MEYCKLDFTGARLSSETRLKMAEYVSWENESDFDSIKVVSDFRIYSANGNEYLVKVSVCYIIVGVLNNKNVDFLEYELSKTRTRSNCTSE